MHSQSVSYCMDLNGMSTYCEKHGEWVVLSILGGLKCHPCGTKLAVLDVGTRTQNRPNTPLSQEASKFSLACPQVRP